MEVHKEVQKSRDTRIVFTVMLAVACALILFCVVMATRQSIEPTVDPDAPDYSDSANWAYYGEGAGKDADVFLICPTVDMGKDGNGNMSLANEKVKGNFVGALNMERGIYEESAMLYAPYYRQATFPVYSMPQAEAGACFDIAYSDVRAAFLAYMEQATQDRPLILAGFSQGADMALRLLEEFFDDPVYQQRLVAAYCIGWRVTDEDLRAYPWLCMAQGEDDTGVIVAFNSEAPSVTDSLLVPEGVKTHAINPLNWRTDGTPATAAENLGACFTDYSGAIIKEAKAFCGGYLDDARGTLKLPEVDPADYANALFPDGVYHLYDYQFFYRNLQENVAARTAAYLAQTALVDAA